MELLALGLGFAGLLIMGWLGRQLDIRRQQKALLECRALEQAFHNSPAGVTLYACSPDSELPRYWPEVEWPELEKRLLEAFELIQWSDMGPFIRFHHAAPSNRFYVVYGRYQVGAFRWESLEHENEWREHSIAHAERVRAYNAKARAEARNNSFAKRLRAFWRS